MIYIHIGSINRSGGSLLNRLFDGHPDVASYPIEWGFSKSFKFYPFVDYLNGTPLEIHDFDPEKNSNILEYHNIPELKPKVVHQWGKEKADPVGVRNNYLEKEFYGKIKTDFDYSTYIALLKKYEKDVCTLHDIFDAKHRAYFEAWDNGKHVQNMQYVVTHDSGGIFQTDIDKYFEEFDGSIWIYPIRGITGYIASEKTRIARRYYGSRRFPKIKMPNRMVKLFRAYDLEALIRTFQVAITRVAILQEKFGIGARFIVYRYENLVNNPQEVVQYICDKSGLSFDKCLLQPTIAGYPWGGSSHQGKQQGINKGLIDYYHDVLGDEELELIEKRCGPIMKHLNSCTSTPVDLTKIPKIDLYDYSYQKRYSEDSEKWALYCAYAFTSMRRKLIWSPDITAVLAYIYSKWVHLAHIPRLIKLNLFPGLGKQNYT